jgi:type I restriction enzyme, S subunit
MREGWERKTIGEIALVSYGHTEKSTPEGDYRYIRITDIDENGELDKRGKVYINSSEDAVGFILNDNDLLMARTGATFAKVLLYKDHEPSVFASYLIKISFGEGISNRLYWYFSKSEYYWKQAESLSSGSAQPHFNGAALKKLVFTYPKALSEQKEIVAILDKAFAAIDQAKANIEKNIENAKELFQSKLNEVFSQGGDGWKEKRLIELCTLINGRAYKKAELLEQGKYPVLRVGNLFTNNHWYYSNLELANDKYIDKGNLIYAWSASFGPRIWQGEKVIYHYHIWKVLPDTMLITKEFLYVLLDWDTDRIKKSHGTGTTMIHVSKGSMESRVLPLPPIETQNSIVEHITQLNHLTKVTIANCERRLTILEELKKSVLQKAFSGELSHKNYGYESIHT